MIKKIHWWLVYIFIKVYQTLRGVKYSLLSTATVRGRFIRNQPILFAGRGRIISKGKVQVGVIFSPFSINGYAYLEARSKDALIEIEDNVTLNNNIVICADKTKISIGCNTIMGTGVEIYDSDFHNLEPDKRMTGNYEGKTVCIGKNVFLGSNVTVLKGVTIGDNSIIANKSVVTKDIPANVIAGGNPARIIRKL